jgi:hypothetical protein
MIMEYDIRDTIADFVRKADPDFEKHKEQREQGLGRTSCIHPNLGRWMDIGIEFLFSVLELEDRDFAIRLPILAHLSKTGRRGFLKLLKDHVHACRHCALKHKYELDLNERIEQAFQENSQFLLQQPRAETPVLADSTNT